MLTRGADKSLARPGRNQTTATKLRIYSTYSPRSSIQFLAHRSNFCKPLKKKKNSEGCPSNQVSAAAKTSASDEKWRPLNCFFSPGTGVSPTGPDQEDRVGDQDLGSPGRPVSSGLQVPGEPLGDLPMAFFLRNLLQLHQQRWVILGADSLVLWKIINEEDAVLIPKNQGKNFSSWFFHSEFFGAGWATMPPLHSCCFVSGSVILPGFVHGHQSRQEIVWITPRKFQKLLKWLALLTFLICVQAFWDPLCGELPHVHIFMNDGPNPLMWDAQLLSYLFSRNLAVFQD